MKRSFGFAVAAVLLAGLVGCTEQKPLPLDGAAESAKTQALAEADAKEKAALAAGTEAVVYGLPLVIMDLTQRKSTNVSRPEAFSAPVNQFAHVRVFPDASFKDVVRANVDTLYSVAWLDVSREPMVLSVPDTKGRYYLMPMLDAWTNVFASPGKRTTGTKPGRFAITGPGWAGPLPKGVQQIKAPTAMVWIIGRTQTNGPKDYPAVHAIQNGYRLVPLSAFGNGRYRAPDAPVNAAVDMKTPPVDQLKAMSSAAFFDRLAALLKANPPPTSETGMLAKLAAIGIVPGEKFDPGKLDPAVAKGLEQALPATLAKLEAAAKETGAPVNGWRVTPMNVGNFGSDYGTRAVIALMGLGANLPQDAIYPSAFTDGAGAPLTGANRYVIHFANGATPPVDAFWSLTLYDAQSFFVPNPINRYAISSWMPLKKNNDGSIDIHVQHQSPGKDKESNWLPAAAGPFNVTLRMYWPSTKAPSMLDRSWTPPAITPMP
ncbi:DUF1254 domain-containing protein [Methylolobus aquaticus]